VRAMADAEAGRNSAWGVAVIGGFQSSWVLPKP
jgi:hypothetical protein